MTSDTFAGILFRSVRTYNTFISETHCKPLQYCPIESTAWFLRQCIFNEQLTFDSVTVSLNKS